VRVATFNINNVNKQLDNLLAWLAKAEPDVVSLQELKAEQGAFPVNALRTARVRSSLARGALPPSFCAFAGSRLDQRDAEATSGRAALDILRLQT
jgi:hypothetical protein